MDSEDLLTISMPSTTLLKGSRWVTISEKAGTVRQGRISPSVCLSISRSPTFNGYLFLLNHADCLGERPGVIRRERGTRDTSVVIHVCVHCTDQPT